MKPYNVLITRDTTESTVIDVEADTPEEALEKALEEAVDHPGDFAWVKDDTFVGEPYDGDCVEEVTTHDQEAA